MLCIAHQMINWRISVLYKNKNEILIFGWLIIISLLGGVLFVLSYIEDLGEVTDKQNLQEKLIQLENRIKILDERNG